MQPAIQTARQGFPVGRDLVRYMNSAVGDGEDFLSKDPTWAIDFAPNGTRLGLGDTITRKRYADTLETIANNGPDAFYTGPIAETMIQALQAANGTMTLEDLRNYTVIIRNTSQIDYRGYKVIGTTAPSSGTVALNILKVLDTYDSFMVPGNVNLSTHRLDEAIRFGYGLVRRFSLYCFQQLTNSPSREPNWVIRYFLKDWMTTRKICSNSRLLMRFVGRSPTCTHRTCLLMILKALRALTRKPILADIHHPVVLTDSALERRISLLLIILDLLFRPSQPSTCFSAAKSWCQRRE